MKIGLEHLQGTGSQSLAWMLILPFTSRRSASESAKSPVVHEEA